MTALVPRQSAELSTDRHDPRDDWHKLARDLAKEVGVNDTAQAVIGVCGLVGGLSGILGVALVVARGNRTTSDYQITYCGGATVRRVERGRKVNWLLNGAPVSEQTAKDFMQAKELELRTERS